MSRHFQTSHSKRHHTGSSAICCLPAWFSCRKPVVVVIFFPPLSWPNCLSGQIPQRSGQDAGCSRGKKKTSCAILCSSFELFPSIFQRCNPAKLFVLTSNSTCAHRRADTASQLPLIIIIPSPSPLNNFSFSSTIIESHYKIHFFLPLKILGKESPRLLLPQGSFFIVVISTN